MSDQGLGISGIGGDSAAFDPLLFLTHVAMRDAAQNVTMQEAEMQDKDMQDVATLEEAERGSSGVIRIESIAAKSPDLSSPMVTDSENDSKGTPKGEPNANVKNRARNKTTGRDRVRETASMARRLQKMRAAEEARILEEMKQEEKANKRAGKDAAGRIPPEEIAATGIAPEEAILMSSLEDKDPEIEEVFTEGAKRRRLCQSKDSQTKSLGKKITFFSEFSHYPELFMELAKHLHINDLVSLYAISKDFHETLNGHLSHIMKACASYRAPESSRIFVFALYRPLCTPDPAGRPDTSNPAIPRMVPSLRWLRMVLHREKCVRDILACMAREGHRMPKTMSLTLKKVWLTMDIATSARRVQLIHNENYWTDFDLYNAQLFFVKLDMRFNDPIEGPGDDCLRKLMLGQRGLTPLCQLLKRTRYTDVMEILEAAVRYSYWPAAEHRHLPILGVLPNEIGKGHLEGWGMGQVHLYRVDELVMRESCRRNLQLDKHLIEMMVWGYVDSVTKENIIVTAEEMYMSDDPLDEK